MILSTEIPKQKAPMTKSNKFFEKMIDIKKWLLYNTITLGDIAQLARAYGSYP